ncbi:MAG: recombination mediator RecR [candidate division WOR-3 bacterium]
MTPVLERLIEELQKLPGIGRKTAQRLTFFILRMSKEEVMTLARTIQEAKSKLKYCSICFNFTEEDPCRFCRDVLRHQDLICVVEEPSDVLTIERTGSYKGLYHILHGAISPIDNIGPDQLKIKELIYRVEQNNIKEVIIATNPTTEGEATAIYIAKLLKPLGIKVTRIARGIPMGSDLNLADEITLGRAIEGRREI